MRSDGDGGFVVTNSLSGSADGRMVPRECPPAPKLFVDRVTELARLVELCRTRESSLLFVLDGPPGAGKSALALRLAAQARESFPDGQLYVDLRRHERGGGVDISDVVEGFLRSLGIGGESLSRDFTQQTALLRSLLFDRRMLILVDHVTVAEQVTVWLPDGPGCAVAVTSNLDLSGLRKHGPVRVEVAGLPVDDGVELLAEYCGAERVAAEREAARELVAVCEGLPAVLEVIGARLQDRRSLSFAQVLAELAAATGLKSLHRDVQLVVRTVFDRAFDDLAEPARRLYALLGVHPGADLADRAVAALMPGYEDHLADLRRAHLVRWDEETGRVRFGELVVRHAAAKAEEHLTPEGREMALRRLVRHYLVLASAADLAAMGDRLRLAAHNDEIEARAAEFADEKPALDALDDDRHNLVGMVTAALGRGWFAEVWQLCEAMWPYFLNRKHFRDWIETTRCGAEAARAVQDPAAESRMRAQLARALSETRRFDQAEDELRQAVELAERSGNPRLLASAEEFTGKLHVARGAYDRSIPHFRRALQINEQVGRTRGAAVQHHALAQALHLSGDHDNAVLETSRAMELLESLGQPDLRNRGSVLSTRAKALAALHRNEESLEALRLALPLLRDAGAARLEAQAWELLAELDVAQAPEHLNAAMAIYRRMGDPEAVERVARQLSP